MHHRPPPPASRSLFRDPTASTRSATPPPPLYTFVGVLPSTPLLAVSSSSSSGGFVIFHPFPSCSLRARSAARGSSTTVFHGVNKSRRGRELGPRRFIFFKRARASVKEPPHTRVSVAQTTSSCSADPLSFRASSCFSLDRSLLRGEDFISWLLLNTRVPPSPNPHFSFFSFFFSLKLHGKYVFGHGLSIDFVSLWDTRANGNALYTRDGEQC